MIFVNTEFFDLNQTTLIVGPPIPGRFSHMHRPATLKHSKNCIRSLCDYMNYWNYVCLVTRVYDWYLHSLTLIVCFWVWALCTMHSGNP